MSQPEVIVVNVTSAPGVLGGAVLAAQWHSQYMAAKIPLELWRMWDKDETVSIDRLTVRNFTCQPSFGKLGNYLPKLAQKVLLASDIPKALAANPPKIVHIQNPAPGLEFEKIARQCQQLGTKVVASTHGFQEMFDPQYGYDKFYHKYGWNELLVKPLQRAFAHVDAFLLGYPQQKELLLSKGVSEDKLHLVPNGIDPFYAQPPTEAEKLQTIEKFGLNSDIPILLFMGNHTLNKGIGTLMKVAANLSSPATIVVGGKLLKDEPEKWLTEFDFPPYVKVVFTDFLSVSEQRSLYHISRLFLFPSISETLPLAILEAMGAGLPVIACDVGGISYQLADNAGVVVPLNNFAAFLQAVQTLLDDRSACDRISERSKARQQTIFDWEKLADKTIEIYEQLVPLTKPM
jgi:alpha-maltose-1-phosphate synthase